MQTVEKLGTSEITINRSTFYGFCHPINSEEDALKIINNYRNKYHDARHVVFAYVLHPNIMKIENDSEPAGTAGPPIYNAITKVGLTNTLVVVVRYFGGILLGAGPLLRAYSQTAVEAIKDAGFKKIRHCFTATLQMGYENLKLFEINCKKNNVDIISIEYLDVVKVKVAFEDKNDFTSDFMDKVEKEKIWL